MDDPDAAFYVALTFINRNERKEGGSDITPIEFLSFVCFSGDG